METILFKIILLLLFGVELFQKGVRVNLGDKLHWANMNLNLQAATHSLGPVMSCCFRCVTCLGEPLKNSNMHAIVQTCPTKLKHDNQCLSLSINLKCICIQ